jgi:hypothetical protein
MDLSVLDVFNDECKNLVIDTNFIKRLSAYQTMFVHKNADHVAFFGGVLIGVQTVRFTVEDTDKWFNDIIEADDVPLEERLLKLPLINPDWNVSSDTLNLSVAWLVHTIYKSKTLTREQKHQGMVDALLVLQYKFLTSRLYRHFRFPADKTTAQAAYAQLSNKFAIKRYGSWSALLTARAEEIISPSGIHRRTIETLDDEGVRYMLNDIQGRIRDMLKKIFDVFLKVHASGKRIISVSSSIEHDGVEILKDKTKSLTQYTRYLNSIVSDKNSFVRMELLGVVSKMVKHAPPKLIIETLSWMSNNYRQRGAALIEDVLNETMIHSFDYLNEDKSAMRNQADLPALLSRLKGVYMSSRTTDPVVKGLRDKTEMMAKMATGNKNGPILASVRTAVLLYIVLRTFTMKHYSASIAPMH